MPQAYEGVKPYIFVSYSHRDNNIVHRIIESLQQDGYRVWFDGGIEAGSEWPEYIATHLEGCACVLAFISDTFVESHNCKRELNFAQELKKPLLNVYIEDVELTAGMRMQLGLSQALFRKNYADEQGFLDALCKAKILMPCRDAVPVKQTDVQSTKEVPTAAAKEEEEKKTVHTSKRKASPSKSSVAVKEEEEKSEPMPKEGVRLGWIMAILELSYCVISGYAMAHFTDTSSGFSLFGLMLIPHTVIAVINLLLLCLFGKKLSAPHRDNLCMIAMAVSVLSSLIGIAVGTFNVAYQMAGVLKLLLSLGLNLAPALVAVGIYFGMIVFSKAKE